MTQRTTTRLGLVSIAVVAGAVVILRGFQFPPSRSATALGEAPPAGQQALPPEQEELARDATEPFVDAESVRSVAGVLRYTLVVKYADNVIRGAQVHLRSYNGRLVGQTLRAKPGDILKIRLENQLPPNPDANVHVLNVPHTLNSTNIHTHGLHVSPTGNSDNVYLDIKPGETQDYEIKIPQDHVAGTFWYHPHRHGSVALQVASGMAGALIIEGGLDDVPQIKQAQERILLFQQISFDQQGRVEKLSPLYDGKPVQHWDASGRFTTINGVALPVLHLRPGEVQRWRMIHGGVHESLAVRLDGHKLHEIATDGIPLGSMVERDEIELQPGNRSDVLVQASQTPGVYLLRDGELPPARSLHSQTKPEKFLAKVIVAGPPVNMPLPDSTALAACAPLKPISDAEVAGRKTTLLFRPDEAHQPPRYYIDGQQFDPDAVPRRVLLGTAEEWTLTSTDGNHPFHIHVNPFEVIQRDPKTGRIIARTWRDTILVAKDKPITIRTRYLDFTGKTVLHCHNLAHEDLGMMQNIEIVRTPAELKKKVGLSLPWQPPPWKLPDASGRWHSLAEFQGRPVLIVFYLGAACPNCLRQLALLRDLPASAGKPPLPMVAISPDSPADVLRARSWLGAERILLLSDERLEVFRKFSSLADDEPRHGLFLVDSQGEVVWYRVSAEAITDFTPLQRWMQ